ncbi:MAG: response regulator, partial [Vallitaleaceae bacterium]|nr:response regulator [Vallitaleaceae bacterium]
FFTTKGIGEGTGLGLSESYGTIVAHSGAIFVQTELEKGTTFLIYLPVSSCDEPILIHSGHEMKNEYSKVIASSKKTILLIDDEPVMRSVLELFLNDVGYDVYTADNGMKGLEIYREKYKEIDLVLLDMMMPKLNGTDTFREMKKISPLVKVILVSGYTDDEKIEELYQEGIYGFFKKPFRLEEIAQMIENL